MAAVLLRADDDRLPIFIGLIEAMSSRTRHGLQWPCPVTHDLPGDVIVSADPRMQRPMDTDKGL